MRQVLLAVLILANLAVSGQFNCQNNKFAPVYQSTTPIDYNSRSDTADLQSLKLDIDTRGFGNAQLIGKAEYQIGVTINFTQLRFDLLGFTVDSVVSMYGPLLFNQSGEHLVVSDTALAGDSLNWTIYYHGNTTKDASGWGGMHHDGAYDYNLGVGFAANPHVYGRSVFPCFDNFIEKCVLEEMNIITSSSKVGVSNGILSNVDTLITGDLIWHWKGQAPLPSYLVSVAVSDYHRQSWTHGGIPFEIYGRAQDTANMSAGFIHLNDIFDAFVNEFGPYPFEKVGYALTITGAMEHAGMIHLPRTLANINLNGEDIIAHELAHMWFGNAITTSTAQDMWINEGFAEFGSHFYEEKIYGRSKYVNTVQKNQGVVLKQAALSDGGHLALSGVNQDQTYGMHTYQKGAMVAHNLREYLGDSLFSHGMRQLIALRTYGNYDVDSFKQTLETATGINLTEFWLDWIYTPGYHSIIPHKKNSFTSGQQPIRLHRIQSNVPNGASAQGKSTPIWLYKHSYNSGHQGKVFLGYSGDFPANYQGTQDLQSGADWLSVNDSAESLGASVYDSFEWSELTGTKTLANTGVKITPTGNPNNLNGRFYVWHHRTEGMYSASGEIGSNHVYFIGYEGSHNPPLGTSTTLPFEVTIKYNKNQNQGGLDYDLANISGDSLTLCYFKTGELPSAGIALGNVTNQTVGNFGVGNLTFTPQLLSGFYRIGKAKYGLGMEGASERQIRIYPNPSQDLIRIDGFQPELNVASVQIFETNGVLALSRVLTVNQGSVELSIKTVPNGVYTIRINDLSRSMSILR